MFPAKPLRFRADLVCARSLRGRRRSSERRFFVPWRFCASSRLAGEPRHAAPPRHAALGVRGSGAHVLDVHSPGTRARAHDPPRRANPSVRTLARCPDARPRRAAPMREPRRANSLRVLYPCCSRSARKAHAGQLARRAHAGRLMRTAQADPRVPRPCELACVRGRSPGKMLRRCAPEAFGLGAFLSVQPWQYIVLMHSRAFSYGSKLPWCIPEGATDGKNTSWWQHIAGMYSNTANFGKICVPCIQKALQNAAGECTARISCHQEALLLPETIKSCMACKSCHPFGDLGFSAARHLPWKIGCAPCLGGTGVGHKKGDPCGSPFCSCWLGMSRPSWLDAS